MHETHDNTQATLAFLLVALRGQYVSPRAGRTLLKTWFLESERPIDRIAVERGFLGEPVARELAAIVSEDLGREGSGSGLGDEEAVEAEVLRLLAWTGFEPDDEAVPEATRGEELPLTVAWPAGEARSGAMAAGAASPQLTAGALMGFDPPSALDPLNSSVDPPPADADKTRRVLTGTTTADVVPPPGPGEEKAEAVLPYVVLERLAEGGLGEVLVAKDVRLNRKIALKRILPRFSDDERSRARFQVEAEITGGLEHPGIVPIYAIGAYDDERPFYAMRLVDGETLRAAIDRLHQPPVKFDSLAFRKLLGRFVAVCNVVAYAHSRRVLHRDIKPSNILLGKYGETLLIDWGLAKVIDGPDLAGSEPSMPPASAEPLPETASTSGDLTPLPTSGSGLNLTIAGSAVGTPAYMSPEQARCDKETVGTASDVYGLGATLYAILTGRSPGGTRGGEREVLRRVAAGQIARPRDIKREVPEPLEAICLRAMSTLPRDRYETPKALADDIERWLAEEPLPWRKESWDRRLSRWEKRRRGVIRAIGAALVLLSVGTLVAATLINIAREKAQVASKEARAGKLAAEDASRQMARSNARLLIDEAIAATPRQPAESLLKFVWAAQGLPHGPDDLERVARGAMPGARERMHSLLGVLEHGDAVLSMQFHPKNPQAVTGSGDGVVRLWSSTDARMLRESPTLPGPVNHLRFSRDGALLLVRGDWTVPRQTRPPESDPRGMIAVLDAVTLRLKFPPIQLGRGVHGAEFAHDGKTFATGDTSGEVAVRESATSKLVWKGRRHETAVGDLEFLPDGRLITGGEDGRLLLLDAATGRTIGQGARVDPRLTKLTVSPDGRHVAALCQARSQVLGIDAEALRPEGELSGLTLPRSVWFTPDSRQLLTSGQTTSGRFWALDGQGRWTPHERYLPHKNYVFAVGGSADGRRLLSAGRDRQAIIWENVGDDPVSLGQPLPHTRPLEDGQISPDGHYVLTREENGGTRLWEIARTPRPRTIIRFPKSILSLAYQPDGREIVAGSGRTLNRIDAETGRPAGPPIDHGKEVWSFAIHPDDGTVAVAGEEKLLLYDFQTGRPIGKPVIVPERFLAVAWHPDGRRLLSGSRDGFVRVIDPKTGEVLKQVEYRREPAKHVRLGWSLRFTPDGSRLIVGAQDGSIHIFDARSFEHLDELAGHLDPVRSLEISGDGSRLLTGSQDSTARIWNLERLSFIEPPLNHENWVTRIKLSPDGQTVATVSLDHHIRLWDLGTGRLTWTSPPQSSGLWSLGFHPDGRSLIVGSDSGSLDSWPLPEPNDDDLHLIQLRAEVLSNLRLTETGETVPLTAPEWKGRWNVLNNNPAFRVRPVDASN